jgi:hypothetical protein
MNEHEQRSKSSSAGNLVNAQRRSEETRKEFSSRHAGRAMNTHEQVWNNDTSIQEAKEAPSHTNGQQ